MAAYVLKHHCQDPDSHISANLRTHPSETTVGSGCTGTGAFFGFKSLRCYMGGRIPIPCLQLRFEECVRVATLALHELFNTGSESEVL